MPQSASQRNLAFLRDLGRIFGPGRKAFRDLVEDVGEGELLIRPNADPLMMVRFGQCEQTWINAQVRVRMKAHMEERRQATELLGNPDPAAKEKRREIQRFLRQRRTSIRRNLEEGGGILGAMAADQPKRTSVRNGMIVCLGMLIKEAKAEAQEPASST